MRKLIFCALLASAPIVVPIAAHAQISISVNIAPPELPVYVQPPIPGDGYLWSPGYWAWGPDEQDYYWVPGTWVQAPFVGALWTPGYWGWSGGAYVWNQGYWGDHVGFYGGVNYGFGYVGTGYLGGRWDHGAFAYNTAVTNVTNVHVTNVYNTVVNNNNVTHVSYNGGNGGVRAQPSPAEVEFAHAQHTGPLPTQVQNEQVAHRTPELRASANHGKPPITATQTPGKFNAPNAAPERATPAPASPHPGMNFNPGENAQHQNPAPPPHAAEQPPQRPQQQIQPRPQQTPPQQPAQRAPQPQPQEMHQPQPQPREIPQAQPHPAPPQNQHQEQRQEPHQEPHQPPHQPEEKDQHHD